MTIPELQLAYDEFSAALRDYTEHGQAIENLERLIDALERLVGVAPQEESAHGIAVMQLAAMLGEQWARTRDDKAWQRAVQLVDTWKEQVPPPDWRAALYLLADGVLRYRRGVTTADAADVDEAIAALEAARARVKVGSGVHGTASAFLGDLRLRRFEAMQQPLDLETALTDALSVAGSDRASDGERSIAARTLCAAFTARYKWTGHEEFLDAAVEAGEEAVRLAAHSGDLDARTDSDALLGSALRARYACNHDPHDLDRAIDAYQRAAEAPSSDDASAAAIRLDNLGNGLADRYRLLRDVKDLEAAIASSRRALALFPAGDSGRRRTLANLGTSLTEFAVVRRDGDLLGQALEAFRKGLTIEGSNSEVTVRLHIGVASALLLRGVVAPREPTSALDEAVDHLVIALDEALRDEAQLPVAYRLGRFAATAVISRRLVGALLLRARSTTNLQEANDCRRRALAVAEATKSPLLVEELLRRTLPAPQGVPEGTIAWEEQLLARRAALDVHELVPTRGTILARRLHRFAKRTAIATALDDVWRDISAASESGRQYVTLRQSPSSALASLLRDAPTAKLLSFMGTEYAGADGEFHRGLAAMAWRAGFASPEEVFTLDHDPIPKMVESLSAEVPADRGAEETEETWWHELAGRLERRARSHASLVVVSPSDDGAALPWYLLLERAQGWLDRESAVTVVPSLALALLPTPAADSTWQEIKNVAEYFDIDESDQDVVDSVQFMMPMPTHAMGDPLVVGNPSGDLSAASDEAAEIARLLGVQPLVGPDATVDAVVSRLANSPIIHIAAHAEFDPDDPMRSAIHLYDGDLTVDRLIGAWSAADIVILSACEGARGAAVTGGEILGLATALMRAGVDTLVASLWRVDDAASAYLMKAFHVALLRRVPPAHALADAQRRTRAESGWEAPYYWAGFVAADRGAARAISR